MAKAGITETSLSTSISSLHKVSNYSKLAFIVDIEISATGNGKLNVLSTDSTSYSNKALMPVCAQLMHFHFSHK